jgi:hypothetical protein
MHTKGHFTHETESPWPLLFKHSHRWKRYSRSKFASHYTWGTNGVSECKMDVKSTWHWMDHVSWLLELFSKATPWRLAHTKPGDHDTPNTHNNWFNLLYHVWGHVWIEIQRNSIWLRARSHMTSHYIWGSVTTLLHEFGGVLGHFPFGLSQFYCHGLSVKWPWLDTTT